MKPKSKHNIRPGLILLNYVELLNTGQCIFLNYILVNSHHLFQSQVYNCAIYPWHLLQITKDAAIIPSSLKYITVHYPWHLLQITKDVQSWLINKLCKLSWLKNCPCRVCLAVTLQNWVVHLKPSKLTQDRRECWFDFCNFAVTFSNCLNIVWPSVLNWLISNCTKQKQWKTFVNKRFFNFSQLLTSIVLELTGSWSAQP